MVNFLGGPHDAAKVIDKHLLPFLEQYAASRNPSDVITVVDMGSGYGLPSCHIATQLQLLRGSRAVNVIGVTLAEHACAISRSRAAEKGVSELTRFVCGDFCSVGESLVSTGSADVVMFLDSLCHTQNIAEALAEAHRCLAPGGLLFVKDFYANHHHKSSDMQRWANNFAVGM